MLKHSWSPSLNFFLHEDGSKISFATLPLMNRHPNQTSYWKRKTPLHHWPPWCLHHRPPWLHYQRPPSPSHRNCQHCEPSKYHIDRVELGVPMRLWFYSNIDHRWIDRQTHWNGSLPKLAKMWSTKSVSIGHLWKWIALVSNSNNQKGSSWIWSRADSRNVRFESSYPSAVQRSVDYARFYKMVSTRFTPAIDHVFLLMHFMITTWTWSRQMRSLGRSKTVPLRS